MTDALRFVGTFYDNGVDAVSAFDTEFRYLYWSPVMERLSGISRDQALGKSAYELFSSLRRSAEEEHLRGTLQGRYGIAKKCFYAAALSAGTEDFDAYYSPLHGEDGTIVGGLTVARSRKERTEIPDLREVDSRFRTMADCSPVLLWMSGPDALCNFFNQTWLDFTGRTLEQEIGYGWAEGVWPEDFESCVGTYMKAFNERRPFEMVYRLRRHDGDYRWLLDRATPLHSPTGEFAGFIGSCIDITDRKTAEDTARSTARRLARANAQMENFLYAASHDLREPIRTVASFIELFTDRYGTRLDETGRDFIDHALKGAMRMSEMVEGLMVFAHARHADSYRFEPTSSRAVVEQALEDFRLHLEKVGGEAATGELPLVRVDAARLGRVFQNLVANAIKFRSDAPVRIRIGAERRGSEWLFAVEDNGIGIDARYADRIFVMFQRLLPRSAYEGNGIGLAVCKEIVEMHGGKIWVESKPGEGATFFFTLPAVTEPSGDATGGASSTAADGRQS